VEREIGNSAWIEISKVNVYQYVILMTYVTYKLTDKLFWGVFGIRAVDPDTSGRVIEVWFWW
jgi:hypothetical protein